MEHTTLRNAWNTEFPDNKIGPSNYDSYDASEDGLEIQARCWIGKLSNPPSDSSYNQSVTHVIDLSTVDDDPTTTSDRTWITTTFSDSQVRDSADNSKYACDFALQTVGDFPTTTISQGLPLNAANLIEPNIINTEEETPTFTEQEISDMDGGQQVNQVFG